MLALIPEHGRPIQLTADTLVIGREASCDLVLRDKTVSRRHAIIERRPDGWVVTDKASINGIRVDGQRVTEALLQSGQKLSFGSISFLVEIAPETPEPTLFMTDQWGSHQLDDEPDDASSSSTVSLSTEDLSGFESRSPTSQAGPSTTPNPALLWALAIGLAWMACVASLGIAYVVLRDSSRSSTQSTDPSEAPRFAVPPRVNTAEAVRSDDSTMGPSSTPGLASQPLATTVPPAPVPTPQQPSEPTPTTLPPDSPPPQALRLQARPFASFDTRLSTTLLARRGPTPKLSDIVGIATGALLLFPGQLVAQTSTGVWTIRLDFRATHVAQLEDGSVWLRRGDQMIPLDATNPNGRPFPVAPGSLVRSHSADGFVVGTQESNQTLVETLAPSGARIRLGAIPGALHALSRTKTGVAAVIGSSVYLKAGGDSFRNLDTALEYEGAIDIVPVFAERALVSLRGALLVVGPGHRTTVALLRGRLSSNGEKTFVYDLDSGSLWEAKGFDAVGPFAADQARAKQLLATALSSCRSQGPCSAYDEAARLIGAEGAAAALRR